MVNMKRLRGTWTSNLGLLLFVLVSSLGVAKAGPVTLQDEEDVHVFQRRANNSSSTPSTIWIPIVVSAVVLIFLMVIVCARKAIAQRMLALRSNATSVNENGVRELTAEQLAGTINNGAPAGAAPATRRSRRPRRHRRTPSQMSVTSLPEYMKEPGEEEVVIFRGRDMEDAGTMPAAIVMDPLDEERDEEQSNRSQGGEYEAVHNPASANERRNGDNGAPNEGLHPPQTEDLSRASMESSQESSSLMRVDSNAAENSPDPLGPTPAYFEAIDEVSAPRQPLSASTGLSAPSPALTTSSPPSSPEVPVPPQASQSSNPNRRSGFRTFLNRMSIHGAQHTRGASGASVPSSQSHHGHRPSNSQSSSFFHALSRQKSTHTLNSAHNMNLTSPSMISLNSISAPLTHTAVRTEFTYPRTGPTPEQLKIIASRESIGRFGMPYGPDAVAFASSSRADLLPPPPEFDYAPSGRQTGMGSGAGDLSQSRVSLSLPSPASPRSASRLRNSVDLGAGHARNGSDSSASSGAHRNISGLPTRMDSPLTMDVPGLPSSSIQAQSATSPATVPANGRPSSPLVTAVISTDPLSASTPPRTPPLPHAPSSSGPKMTEFGLKLPPSSFHDPVLHTIRSESVASMYSARTYATAAESLNTGTARSFAERYGEMSGGESDADGEGEGGGGEERMVAAVVGPEVKTDVPPKHQLEPTDATIKPGVVKTPGPSLSDRKDSQVEIGS